MDEFDMRYEDRMIRRQQVLDFLATGSLDLAERVVLQAELVKIEEEELADMRRALERELS